MLLLFSIAGAAALAVVAYTRLRARSPEAALRAHRQGGVDPTLRLTR